MSERLGFFEFLDRVGERRAKIALRRSINLRLLANVIGCALVFGFLGALFALFIIPVPKGNEQIVTYMIGQLSGFAGGIVAYHYTSKAGEREETAQRLELQKKQADTSGRLVDLALGGAVSKTTIKALADMTVEDIDKLTLDELLELAKREGLVIPDPPTEVALRALLTTKRAPSV